MRVLAWDIGTSAVKAAVLDVASAQPVSEVLRRPLTLQQEGEAATLDPEEIWSALVQVTRPLAERFVVEGIGMCCLTPGWLLLDNSDKPLTPVITHLDRRSRPLARQVWESYGEAFLQDTGNKPLPGGLSGIACGYLLQAQPLLRARVGRFVHLNGWLCLRLTGETAFDFGNACFTGLFDYRQRRWSPRWCRELGIEAAWLSDVADGRTTIGGLKKWAADEFGLPAGVPVKLGVADTSAAVLAAQMQVGDLLHVVGTTQVLATLVEQPRPGLDHLTRMLGVGSAFLHVAHNPVGGVALEWVHRLCFRDQSAEVFYTMTLAEAWHRSTNVVLDPPYLGGDRLAIEPAQAGFRNLQLSTDRLDLLSAVLHAMHQQHYRALAALQVGQSFRRVFLTGGGAEVIRSLFPEYRQEQVILLEEGSLRGVAKLFAKDAE
ncbi:MAG: FGGY-family carbohydrate kinase [Gemmatales bacterium]|nr:FGGY-family carbohydrate kinase [Gemmatales bacterium]MDW8176036.1 FGGY-family carbohydrate kinase [Gemmatales bacterium]